MGKTCCCCFSLKAGVAIIFVIDILAFISHIINIIIIARVRGDLTTLYEKIAQYVIDNKIHVSGLTLMDLKNMLDATLDFLLAAPIILVVGIFLPRIVMFAIMKAGKNNKKLRNY